MKLSTGTSNHLGCPLVGDLTNPGPKECSSDEMIVAERERVWKELQCLGF